MSPSHVPEIAGHNDLDAKEKQEFADWLKGEAERPLRHRGTCRNIATYVDGHKRCKGKPSNVADIQEAAGLPQGREKGPLFGLISASSWRGDALHILARGIAKHAPTALLIDLSEYRVAGCAYEVFSVHADVDGYRLPFDWGRIRIESEEAEDDVEGRCRELALKLVDGFDLALREQELPVVRLPVVATQQSLAENSPLRPALAERNIEYALGISTEYHARVALEPKDGLVSDGMLPAAAFRATSGVIHHLNGAAVGLRDVRSSRGGPFLDEHLVKIDSVEDRYFIARGHLEHPPRIASYAIVLRSIEVAEIAKEIPRESLADSFGVTTFSHPSDAAWRNHLLLLSLYELFRFENKGE